MTKIYINTVHNTGYYFVIVSSSYQMNYYIICLHKQATNKIFQNFFGVISCCFRWKS